MTDLSTATSSWWAFIKGFVRSPRSVGSIAPSSRWLVRDMLADAGVEQAALVVEYGPGTGVFTDEIVRRLRPDAQLLVFEVNAGFMAGLRARIADPRVALIEASAATLPAELRERGLGAPDCIVSGLPFTSLPRAVTEEILNATYAALPPGGRFVTYQYTPALRGVLARHFDTSRITRLVLRNLPPALVFVCRRER